MMKKTYISFNEINNDLAIAKLERDIALEKVKRNLNEVKLDFTPIKLMGGLTGILKNVALTLILKRIFKH